MSDTLSIAQLDAVLVDLRAKWRRSELAPLGIDLPDPGHNRDEICPILELGIAQDIERAADIDPFAPEEIADQQLADGTIQEGTGFLELSIIDSGEETEYLTAGETRSRVTLTAWITIPRGHGERLAHRYAGALATSLRNASWDLSAVAGSGTLRNVEPPPETPQFAAEEEEWLRYRWDCPLVRRAHPAVAAA